MLSRFFEKNAPPDKRLADKAPPTSQGQEQGAALAADHELLGARWAPAQAPSKPSPQGPTAQRAAGAQQDSSGFDKTIPAPLLEAAIQAAAPQAGTLEQRKMDALAVVDAHHHRIGNTIRTMWGYPECSVYINKLIMSGGDGMGHNRVGFSAEAVQAMLELADLHDQEYGAPDLDANRGSGPMTPLR